MSEALGLAWRYQVTQCDTSSPTMLHLPPALMHSALSGAPGEQVQVQ